MKRIILFIVCISLTLIPGCSTATTNTQPTIITNASLSERVCDSQKIADYLISTADIVDVWIDQFDVAGATPLIALSGPISELQKTRREFKDIDAPLCAELLRTYLLDSMDKTIEGLLAFMSDDEQVDEEMLFIAATESMEKAVKELNRLEACLPNCAP